jgi:hypothetical protein
MILKGTTKSTYSAEQDKRAGKPLTAIWQPAIISRTFPKFSYLLRASALGAKFWG